MPHQQPPAVVRSEFEAEPGVFRSKWGYHPCDYETYLKLKKLKKAYWKSRRTLAQWRRWARKDKHNRVIREWYRNALGQRVGCKVVGQAPEPQLDRVFVKHEPIKVYFDKDGHYHKVGVDAVAVAEDVIGQAVLDSFEASYPVQDPKEVRRMPLSVGEIDQLLSRLWH